jgi:O-antigen/teichoic acid export membrane protein
MSANVSPDRRAIAQNIATLFSGSIVAQGMTALALLLTARQLSVDGYGQYAACVAISSMASILFSLGLDLWLLREGGSEPRQLPVYAGSVLAIKGAFGLVWMAAFFLLVPLLKQETYPASLLRWSLLLIWLDTLLATTLTAFKAGLHNRAPSVLEASADALWCGLTVGLIFLGVRQPDTYLMVRVIVSASALMLGWVIFRGNFGLRFELAIARQALRGSFPFAASEFLGMVTMRADVVIVGLTLGKVATGLYSPSVGLINMAFLAPLAVYLVAVPVLSNLYKNHTQQARRTAVRFILLSIGLGVLLTAGFAAAAPLVVHLLGSAFKGSVEILRILSLVLLFKSVSFAMAAIILATNQQARRTGVQAIAAGFNIFSNILVVYWIGINGVAGIYVLTEVILVVGYAWIVWRKW